METLSCVVRARGVTVLHPDASESFIPYSLMDRSPVLRSVVAEAHEGSNFQLQTPKGCVLAWLRALSTQNEVQHNVEELGQDISAADYLADEELLQRLCGALSQAVGHYCHSDHQYTTHHKDSSIVPQVLEGLSGPLVATVLRAAPVSLAQQLRRLPPSTHPHAMHATYQTLESASSLALECSDHDATSATLALNAVACSRKQPLRALEVGGISCLATLQAPTIPDDFVFAVERACRGVKHVSLDLRDFKSTLAPDAFVTDMDPSATKGMMRGLGGNTALESLEVKMWECGPVAAFLEGGGCARQLKSLKLDIEGPCSEAALQAMAACTALTHLTLGCSLFDICGLAAKLQCMSQLKELHLTLGTVQEPAVIVSDIEAKRFMDPIFNNLRSPEFSLNRLRLRWGPRFPGHVMDNPYGGAWRQVGVYPKTCPVGVYPKGAPSNECNRLSDALARLTALSALSLQGSWFRENPDCASRAAYATSALQICHVSIPDVQQNMSGSIQMMFCGLESLCRLREGSLDLKAPQKPSRVKGYWSYAPGTANELLGAMQKLNLHSVCTSLQFCIRTVSENGLEELWKRLTAFTCLKRLQLSRFDNPVATHHEKIRRVLAPQADLASLGSMLVNLTYLKIGVSFAESYQAVDMQHVGGRGGAGRGGRRGGLGRGRGSGGAAFYLSGLICAIQNLTLLKHLSMYSRAPQPNGQLYIGMPDEGEVRALGEAMQRLTTLSKLSLKGTHICSTSICSCIARLPALKALKLDGEFNASKGWSESTMQGFSSLRQLQRLTVNRLHGSEGIEGVAQLLDAVAPAGELHTLSVGWVLGEGSSTVFKRFTKSLGQLRSMQVLNLEGLRFTQHCGQHFAECISKLRLLRVLSVTLCELNGADVRAICHSLRQLQEVVRVHLLFNRLQYEDVLEAWNILNSCTRLTSVQLGFQMPFLQCPCCDYFTLPRWSFYNAWLDVEVLASLYLKMPEEYFERWLCPVCQWNSWEAPGAEDIESLLDKQTEANSTTLRQAREKFQEACRAGTAQDGISCGRDEFERFEVKPRDAAVVDEREPS